MLKYLTIILTATAILTAAQEEELPGTPRSSYGLGSAAYLEDCNLLYSLFVDTPENCFTEQDREQALQQLGIACDYIEEQAVAYGKEAALLYDFSQNEDLSGTAEISFEAAEGEAFAEALDEEIAGWKQTLVSYGDLQERYQASGIAMIVWIKGEGTSYAIVFDGTDSPLESVVLFSKDPPAAYAHEILHLFGAHDLYRGAEYQRPVTDYIKKEYPLEIMYTITDEAGKTYEDRIVNTLSPVTAYQLGWLEETEELLRFPELKRSIFY